MGQCLDCPYLDGTVARSVCCYDGESALEIERRRRPLVEAAVNRDIPPMMNRRERRAAAARRRAHG